MSKSLDQNPLSKSTGDETFANAPTLEQGLQQPQTASATQADDKETLKASANAIDIPGDHPVIDDATARSDGGNPFQQECGLNSSIWQLYQDKARSVDEHLKESHNSGLDSLLIFAGLFSAVLSAFLIEARKGLQPDPQATTNALLEALLQSHSGAPQTYNPPTFKPSLSFKVVNGLWFCSLFFSLLSALGASLAKSWVADYAQVQHKPNAEDAYHRHLRFLGISSWHLTDIVTSLPILLHIAFFLFGFGLAILLFGDYVPIGAITLVLTVVALMLYLGTATVSVFYPDCPYQTPLTTFLIRLLAWILKSKQQTLSLSNISKAQLLLWLHDICLGSTEMDQVIIAIAGLDQSPDVQDVLHHSRFAETLCDGLSSVNTQPAMVANMLSLKAYFYVILHLLRTGFPHIGDDNEQYVKSLLVQLVTQGGPLYDCSSLPADFQEVAICIKAQILLCYPEIPRDQVFKITIPLYLKSVTQEAHQKMLQEVHLLGLATNQKVLSQLHGEQKMLRFNAYKQVEEMAKENNAIVIGYSLVVNEIYTSIPSMFVKKLKTLKHLLHKYRMYIILIQKLELNQN
ncbi:hypothetical protein GALMADRAFT_715861 [Galerina marginata CBS 339.88]|uniref:DUF6535 domain-containing protein n=1 Tax=Galerina marginata (strain CBS 339.88) TaxID=685588 RepID=A0A067TMY7_GALM3|nr:hypothetical protein GALMADRAFT_715861 [Galerina marginata CBS 339.88]